MSAQSLSYTLSNGKLRAQITDFGAALTSLRLADCPHDLVLGYPSLDDQIADRQYMGTIIGRYASRISTGKVLINGTTYQLECNEHGTSHLHGGTPGFATRGWTLDHRGSDTLTLSLQSPDGEAGFPGNLTARATYTIQDTTLRLTLMAESDADTIVNLCHHPYFNLSGTDDTTDHQLRIAAEHYLPSDDSLIPTGKIADVAGTRYDFRTPRGLPEGTYNTTFSLHHTPKGHLRRAATLTTAARQMELWTTQPGLHLYNAYKLRRGPNGHHGRPYGPGAAICLESQAWPDSPHHSTFPSVTLRAGVLYSQVTEYRMT